MKIPVFGMTFFFYFLDFAESNQWHKLGLRPLFSVWLGNGVMIGVSRHLCRVLPQVASGRHSTALKDMLEFERRKRRDGFVTNREYE